MLTMPEITARVNALRYRSNERDMRNGDVQMVRQGKISQVYPNFFPDGIDQNVVANFIDVVARDLSEMIAPLPAINCSAVSSVSDRARLSADKRTRIAANYFRHSDLEVSMFTGSDQYVTYGFLPFIIELDDEAKLPRIRLENPIGSYPEFDRYGRCIAFVKRYSLTLGELVAQFPDFTRVILGPDGYKQDMNGLIEMIRYWDKDQSVIYLPTRSNLVLSQAPNPLGKMMVIIARRPSVDGQMRGQFDDVLGIQLLRNRFALMAMEAAEKSVQAPIVLPNDVQELQLGGDAVIRTSNPAGVRRVSLEIPAGAFNEQEILNQELRMGARYPEARSGNMKASIVTGAGVEALMGAFDSQIKSAQAIFASTLRQVISLCFEVDEKLFNEEKTIRGVDAGSPYAITYLPSKDIKGDYTAEVRYGMLAGLNPAQGLIFMLQALGGKLISHDMAMREMPFNINVTMEQEKIEVEDMRQSLLGAVAAYVEAIPQMATQGQDPSPVIYKIAQIIARRQKGEVLEKIMSDVFAPEVPPAGPNSQSVEQTPSAPDGSAGGPPQQGEQVGQAAEPMAGPGIETPRPELESLLSGMNAQGKGTASVRTRNTRVIG